MRQIASLVLVLSVLDSPLTASDGTSGNVSNDWIRLRQQATCEAMQDEYCLGRYGFTIRRDGTFQAGPSAQGRKAEGRITPAELQELETLMASVSPDAPPGEVSCTTGGVPGVKDQVDVTFTAGPALRIYDLGGSVGQLCYRGNRESAERLHQFLRKLLTQYYPIPFA